MFHIFGICAPLGALALSLLIGGDPIARIVFWIGAAMIALGNVGLVYLTSKPERYNATAVGMLWMFVDGRRAVGGLLLRSVLRRS